MKQRYFGRPVFQRPCVDRERSRFGENLVRAHARSRVGMSVRSHSIHSGPDAVGHYGCTDLQYEDSGVPLSTWSGVHPTPIGRRNQPVARQDARGAVGDYAGEPRDRGRYQSHD